MRDYLDNLRFKLSDIQFSIKTRFEEITDGTKYTALSLLVVLMLGVCTFIFLQSYGYEKAKGTTTTQTEFATSEDTLKEALKLMSIGSTSESFDLLATHKNHFAADYTHEELETLNLYLEEMTSQAKEADIETVYAGKDLDGIQPIYKFKGIISQVDNDPMYGVTHTVSKDGERSLEQLEVTGLDEYEVGDKVEFYGVPKFDSVTSPIKVEAYESSAE